LAGAYPDPIGTPTFGSICGCGVIGSVDDPLGTAPVAHVAQPLLGAAKPACSTTVPAEQDEQLEQLETGALA
jgi:hypothetical protein